MTQEENERLNKALDEIEKELEQVTKRNDFISFVVIFIFSFLDSSLVTYFITK